MAPVPHTVEPLRHRARPHLVHRLASALLALGLVVAACSGEDDGGGSDGAAAGDTAVTTPANDVEGYGAAAAADSSDEAAADTAPPGSAAAVAADTAPAGDAAQVASATVTVVPSPYITIAAEVDVAADEPVLVEITATSGDHVVEVPRTAAAATDHAIPLVGMRPERDYDIDVELFDADGEPVGSETAAFTTGALPDDFLDYEISIDPARSSPGFTLVEVSPDEGTPYLLGLDDEGETVWYYRNTGVVGGVEPTQRGTFLSHYWPVGVREFDVLGNVVGNWQFQVNPDDDLRDVDAQADVIDEDLLQQFTDSLAGNPGDPEPLPVHSDDVNLTSFHHEAWPMPNGNILALSTTFHDLTPEQRSRFCPDDPSEFGVVSDVVVEFEPSGRVVRTWDLWDAVDIDDDPGHELCGEFGPFASAEGRDWMHANAAVYDEQRDAVIVSSRHTNQVIALDHGDAEGPQSDVRWIFGENGTMPLDGDPSYYQHAVEVQDDGSILLFDNGNGRPGTAVGDPDNPTYSRAVLYAVDDTSPDPSQWSVHQMWEDRDATDLDGSVIYARFLGDADRLENGDVLITYGGISPEAEDGFDHARITEVVPEGAEGGDIVWDMHMGSAEQPVTVYRSERIPSFYFGPDWITPD
jgi:hypothetical protein